MLLSKERIVEVFNQEQINVEITENKMGVKRSYPEF